MNHAMQSLQSMAGGLPVEEIMKKSFEDLRPEDLGIWKGTEGA